MKAHMRYSRISDYEPFHFSQLEDLQMVKKPTYEELEQKVKELEKETLRHKELEEVLGKSKEQYHDLYENAPNAYFSVSAEDGSILRCNTAALKLLGYDRDTLMGMKVFDLYADNPHGISKAQEVFKRFKKGESIRDVEMQMKHKDGYPIWISLLVEPVRYHNGNIIESRSIVIDITEHKRAEKELQKKTHDLSERVKELNCLYGISKLVEQQDISLVKIIQGIVDLVPPSWQYPEITCTRVIIQGREWKTQNFQETIWKQASDIKVHGELSGNLEVYYLEEKPEIDEGPFLREERKLIIAIAGLAGRIVERKQAEEELRESEEKYRNIFENIQDVYYEVTLDGIILEISSSIEEISIYKREEIIGHSLYDIYVDPKKREGFVKELLKNGKVVDYEILLKDKDAAKGYCSITAKLVRDKHGNPIKIIGSMRNISERKRAEEKVHVLTQELMKAQESERQMISGYLHDNIAQNLSALIIDCETLLDNQPSIRPEIRQKVSEMSKTLRECIKEVRNLSYDLRPPVLDELGLVQALFQYCDDFYEDNGINVDFHSAGMKDLKLDFDTEINLYRLIQEGFVNIKKHADASNVTVKLVAAFPNIILRIEDNGRGFDVQKRLATITKEKRMGIRSMEQRVKLLHGEMEILSRPMQGTKISIKLPYKDKKSGP
jgi:PAS domain S-box-containing protein